MELIQCKIIKIFIIMRVNEAINSHQSCWMDKESSVRVQGIIARQVKVILLILEGSLKMEQLIGEGVVCKAKNRVTEYDKAKPFYDKAEPHVIHPARYFFL
ncbi:hypothetical protein ATANTOWER_020318 [Ataeniobius toweri]|uniref:Uncharacterized protein n=1 Tax=Ataeniobius toweri TaxID=208326 RepID=A0ABU7CBN4_9TELE|nr:hypothetical protein [Ataeniobius toweri]